MAKSTQLVSLDWRQRRVESWHQQYFSDILRRGSYNPDWREWEIYVHYKEIIEYGFSKPIMLNATEVKKNKVLKENKLLKIWNFTQRSGRVPSEKYPFDLRTQNIMVTLARIVYCQ